MYDSRSGRLFGLNVGVEWKKNKDYSYYPCVILTGKRVYPVDAVEDTMVDKDQV